MLDKIFMKKTRRGNILKIVREHYLRDDISCGSDVLEPKPLSRSSLITDPHYIIPDTNIILHQVIK